MRGFPYRTGAASLELGLQRVSWVRIRVRADGVRCEVAGIAHRRPVLRTVSLRTATALVARGVPIVVRSDRGSRTVPEAAWPPAAMDRAG